MATIFSRVFKADLTSWAAGVVTIRPANAPGSNSTSIVAADDIQETTDANGFFATILVTGYYWVWIGNGRPFVIFVPDDTDPYLMADVVYGLTPSSSTLHLTGSNYIIDAGVLTLLNGTTGEWDEIIAETYGGGERVALATGSTTPTFMVRNSCLMLRNYTDENFYGLLIDSGMSLGLGAANVEFANYRVRSYPNDKALQILDTASGYYHTIFTWGSGGAKQIAIGPAT